MIEILCQKDVDKFKANNPYPGVFADYLQARFLELKNCMEEFYEGEAEGEEKEAFNLREFGPLYLLEEQDDLRNLAEIGFNPQDGGFFGSVPEVVQIIEMQDSKNGSSTCFSILEIGNAFNNEYMPFFFVPKEVTAIYPEFQDYLKRWEPEQIVFKPKGEWQQETKSKYLFNGPKYKTQGVDLHVSEKIQNTIWNFIAARKNDKKVPMDYLQIFDLRPEKVDSVSMQIIDCIQEVPPYRQSLSFPSLSPISEKVFVIDDIDHQTMLLASEY